MSEGRKAERDEERKGEKRTEIAERTPVVRVNANSETPRATDAFGGGRRRAQEASDEGS